MDNFRIDLFSTELPIEKEVEKIVALLNGGIDYFHLRKPSLSQEATESLIRNISPSFHSRLILHDYPDLALKYGCGFQFNSRNRAASCEFRMRMYSCHSLSEIEVKLDDNDFLTLSPIFPSISKPGYTPTLNFEELYSRNLRKVIGLGGVTLDKIDLLKDVGFGGAALMGAVWERDNGICLLIKYLKMRQLPFQFITNGKSSDETISQAIDAIKGGCRWIQVRMKGTPSEEIASVLRHLSSMCRLEKATLIVDDHVELAHLCDGVHLGQKDTSVCEARKLLGEEKIIGLTVNTLEQLRESEKCLPDYYGIGPFRFTSTKKNLAPVLGLEGYSRIASNAQRPFVAIGGITQDDIRNILATGADGIAVSSLVTEAESPEKVCKEINHIIEKWKKIL